MQIYNHISEIEKPFSNAVVTIGNFDGVHNGHLALLQKVRSKAEEINGTTVAITFSPHPLVVIRPDKRPPLITLSKQKTELIAATGLIDHLIIIPFDQEFAEMSAQKFIHDLLLKTCGMKAIVVGPDYAFGRKREGNIDLLRSLAADLAFDVIVPDWVMPASGNERISSTRIREVVAAGHVDEAVAMLGRHYQIRGEVISGRKRGGKLLGFPTANIALDDELCPATGVYAVTVQKNDATWQGVANIGYSPTFDDHIFTIEAHLLDFTGDLYGSIIRVNFIKRLRSEMKFSGIEALSEQIQKDIESARDLFSAMETA